MMINKIGIIGLGLIGGSLAKAFKKQKICETIIAMDLDQSTLEKGKREGIVDDYTTKINGAFSDCNIVFLCSPVQYNLVYIDELLPLISSQCILTDVGSTKGEIVEQVLNKGCSHTFIGGHPMTGSEKSGYKASKAHLFENAYYVLTPMDDTPTESLSVLKEIVRSIGSIPVLLSPSAHDYVTAGVSHLPHILASTLVSMVNYIDTKEEYMKLLAAGGFRDFTRIASSSPLMWQQVCLSNKKQVSELIDIYTELLHHFKNLLENNCSEELLRFFSEAKGYRDHLSETTFGSIVKTYDIVVDVEDRPGIIADIASTLSSHNINIKNIGIINSREEENGVLEICFYDKDSQENSIQVLKGLHYTAAKR